jgi:diacylglycerol kinase family enzyme
MTEKHDGYYILINKDAGSVIKMGYEVLEAKIRDQNLHIKNIKFVSAPALFDEIDRHNAASSDLLIGGGDGTIRTAAEHALKKDIPFGILPLGTMNLLAKDLHLPTDLEEALIAYAEGHVIKKIDAATVNKKVFLCCAALGTIPESSEFREDHRGENEALFLPRLTAFVLEQMDECNQKNIRLHIDNRRAKTKSAILAISNNLFDPEISLQDNFRRPDLTGGKLGVYSARPFNFWDKIRLLFKFQIGNWRTDPILRQWEGRDVTVTTGHTNELVSLDGEPEHMDMPLHFEILPAALQVLVPRSVSS